MKKYLKASLLVSILLAGFSSALVTAQQATTPSIDSTRNRVATYRAVLTDISIASSPTNIFRISGSATKTVYVRSISVNGVKTTSGSLLVALYKESTAGSHGTSVLATETPLDSTAVASTVDVRGYTANGTPGTGILIGTKRVAWLSDTAAVAQDFAKWTFGDWGPMSFAVLRGVAQGLAINLLGVTQTGGKATVEVEWMEQ